MIKDLEKFLNKFGEVSDIEIEDDLVEFYLKIDFFVPTYIFFTFEGFEISTQEQQIKTYIEHCIYNLKTLKNKIVSSISKYAKNKYSIEVSDKDFSNKKIYITSVYFSAENTKDVYCISLNTFFEEEHGMGIILKNENILEIGFSDICFSKI